MGRQGCSGLYGDLSRMPWSLMVRGGGAAGGNRAVANVARDGGCCEGSQGAWVEAIFVGDLITMARVVSLPAQDQRDRWEVARVDSDRRLMMCRS